MMGTMNDALKFTGFMVSVILATVLIMITVYALVNHLTFPGNLARIEQLRADILNVQIAASEDVAGQVTVWNQRIRENQYWNGQPIFDLLVADGWDDVEIIELP